MSYDETLAERIRRALPPTSSITEKKMFGGLAFLLDGKMFVGVVGKDLMVRVGPPGHAAALAKKHVRPMDFTGRPLTGYVYVSAPGTRTDASVSTWVQLALAFVATIPAKPSTARSSRPTKRRPARR